MTPHDEPLYERDQSACSRQREEYLLREGEAKFQLLLEHLGPCRRLVDIGCGWGQFLAMASERVEEVWGVDESPERLKDAALACPQAKLVKCRVQKLDLPDGYFDAAVACQILHEVELFSGRPELHAALSETCRVLARSGRFLLLDHLRAADGDVIVSLPPEAMARLDEFERKFKRYAAAHSPAVAAAIRISRPCLQDFVTKAHWLNSAMETLEMNETHNVFERSETVEMLSAAGFDLLGWIEFADIRRDIQALGGKLLRGRPWQRKFLAVAVKR